MRRIFNAVFIFLLIGGTVEAAYIYNPYTRKLDFYKSAAEVSADLSGVFSLKPENTVEVDAGGTEVAGKVYTSIADAITYINTQTPAIDNYWCIKLLDKTNAENFTLPDYTTLTGANGFNGLLTTSVTGNITLGNYSMLNSLWITGAITANGSLAGASPSIFFGVNLSGASLVCEAGYFLEAVTSLLTISGTFQVNGEFVSVNCDLIGGTINVNAGGIFVGNIRRFGGTIFDNTGTIAINGYGEAYDPTTSGLTAVTVGLAIDELMTEKVPYSGATGQVDLGAENLTTTGTLTGDTVTGTTAVNGATITGTTITDGTATLTGGGLTSLGTLGMTTVTGITDILDEDDMASDSATALCTQQSIKAYVDTTELWHVVSGEAELKTARDVDIKADKKLFYN